jgi:hypothetical protein
MTSEGVQPNSPVAVADVDSEHVSHQRDMCYEGNLTLCYRPITTF